MAKWDDDFDPHKERNKENGLTHSEGVANVIKGCLGTGILALPEAFYLAGTINGTILFIFISIFGTYCFHLMVNSQYLLCKIKKVGFLNYAQAMKAAFEVGPDCLKKLTPCVVPIMDFIYLLYQTGTLCVYIIFMAMNLKMVCDQHFSDQPLFMYMLYTFPLVVIICFVPNIKLLTPLTVFANLVSLVTIGAIGWYVCRDLPDFNSLPYVGDWKNFPLFFGTAVFALLSVPSVLLIENNMEDPAYFVAPCGALNIGFGFVSLLYVMVGFMGYWRYGDKIEPTITLNFPETEPLSQTIRALYVVAIWVTYAFNQMVPRDILWFGYISPHLKEDTSTIKKWTIDYILRFLMAVVAYIISFFVPLLGQVISLTGGVCLSLLGILFPAFMEICALWPDNFGKCKWRLWKDLLICLIGLCGLVSSMYASVRDIIRELNVKHCLIAVILAIAASSPVPEANPAPKADPKPSFLAAYAAPGIAYTSAYSAAPLAYSSYVAPAVYPGAYSYYSPYASSYVVV